MAGAEKTDNENERNAKVAKVCEIKQKKFSGSATRLQLGCEGVLSQMEIVAKGV